MKKLGDKLVELATKNKLDEAIKLFEKEFYSNPPITLDGNDDKLDMIANPVGFKSYKEGDFKKSVKWWDSVIRIIEKYETVNNVKLHKGLPLHNKALPLIRLKKLSEARDTVKLAFEEDKRNPNRDIEKSPAYRVLSFLEPLVAGGYWKEDNSVDDEIMFNAFDDLYKAMQDNKFEINSKVALRKMVNNKDLRKILLRRYDFIKEKKTDHTAKVVFAGSILEGVLHGKLIEQSDKSIKAFENIFNENWHFASMFELSNKGKEKLLKHNLRKVAIPRWTFVQTIEVAMRIGIFEEKHGAIFYMLANLLRDYRNLIHPSSLETLKKGSSDIGFSLNDENTRMLVTALDIMLTLLNEPNYYQSMEKNLMKIDMDSGQHTESIPTTTSGTRIEFRDTRSSMASPSRVKMENIKEFPVPTYTNTSSSKSYSNPVMGSTTSTTTTPQMSEISNKPEE